MKVVIMQGVPGSGKSTWVRENLPEAIVLSADSFFYARGNGVYAFDPALVPQAHRECLRAFADILARGLTDEEVVVVDNTNTTVAEVAPYMALAQAYGLDVEIVYLRVEDPERARYRNLHGVPESVVRIMHDRLREGFPVLQLAQEALRLAEDPGMAPEDIRRRVAYELEEFGGRKALPESWPPWWPRRVVRASF